jgi:hypothetical protein
MTIASSIDEPLYLHSMCHISEPLWAKLIGNVLVLECSVCGKTVARLVVVQS